MNLFCPFYLGKKLVYATHTCTRTGNTLDLNNSQRFTLPRQVTKALSKKAERKDLDNSRNLANCLCLFGLWTLWRQDSAKDDPVSPMSLRLKSNFLRQHISHRIWKLEKKTGSCCMYFADYKCCEIAPTPKINRSASSSASKDQSR